MKITDYTESLIEEYLPELLVESKEDQQRFINKFGMDTYNNFLKAKDRLKSKGLSTDLTYYCKHMEQEELINLLASLYNNEKDSQRKRIVQGKDKEVRGEYKYLGESNGYKVYQPLDYIASMDLGVNTGWCTAGRYKHYGHPEYAPSKEDAKKHWDEYMGMGIKFYYFLDSKTMYGKYALTVYPKVLNPQKFMDEKTYIKSTNFALYNDKDELDYAAINELPINLISEEIICDKLAAVNGLVITDKTLVAVYPEIEKVVIPAGVTIIGNRAFNSCSKLTSVTIPDSVISMGYGVFEGCELLTSITIPDKVRDIGNFAFSTCTSLTSINMGTGVRNIDEYAFVNCKSLKTITIPNSVTNIGLGAFFECSSLTNVIIGNSVKRIGPQAFANCKSLTSITIPNSVTNIDRSAFYGCQALTVYTDNEYVKKYLQNSYETISIKSLQ